jgi:hypothetical protein
MPLWKQIMEMYPWVDEENARRMVREGIYQLAKHVHIEAKKLKQ